MTTQRIGIDVGFGYTKVSYNSGGKIKALSFPSVLGRAEHRANVSAGLGGKHRRVQSIEIDGQRFFVGDDAIIDSRLISARQDAGRIGSLEERALMLAALARAGVENALVVTGLPVLWWDHRRDLVRSWRGEHHIKINGRERVINVRQIKCAWQPLGSFYARYLGDDGRATVNSDFLLKNGFGVLDIGMNTTDLSGLVKMRPVSRYSGGVRAGVRDVLAAIAAEIERMHGVRREMHEISAAIESGGELSIYDKKISLNGLASSAIAHLAGQVISQASAKWDQADRFHTVLITGGGAALIGRELRAAFKQNAEILPKPALANAIGFCKYAQRDIFKGV